MDIKIKKTTISDIVRHVEQTDGWFLSHRMLRRVIRGQNCCPISSFNAKLRLSERFVIQGMPREHFKKIICTVDYHKETCFKRGYKGYDPKLRRRFLRAAKLI